MRCGLLGWWHASCLGLLQGHFPKIGCRGLAGKHEA